MFRTPNKKAKIASASSDSNSSAQSLENERVQVFCRLRPVRNENEVSCIKLINAAKLVMSTPEDSKLPKKEIHCTFKHIFTSYALQDEIFENVALPLLQDLVEGKNSLLLTYGVTGSGKTFTLTGDEAKPGVMPKCIYTLFNSIAEYQAPRYLIKSDHPSGFEIQTESDANRDNWNAERKRSRLPLPRGKPSKVLYINDTNRKLDIDTQNLYSVFVSYVEIYNGAVFDLLDEPDNITGKLPNKIIREDTQKGVAYVHGAIMLEVKNADEAFEAFNQGQRRKKMGSTVLNADSSRSHSIFTITVVQFQHVATNLAGDRIVPQNSVLKVSQLNFVDLAGSERAGRTQTTGKNLREASQINNSLMTLRTCLEILRENQQTGGNRLVPFRDSKLTLLFKNFFEGDGHVSMIVCVNPCESDFEENIQVLKFAEYSQDVKLIGSRIDCTPKAYLPKTPRNVAPPSQTKSIKKKTPFRLLQTPTVQRNLLRFDLGASIPVFSNLLPFDNEVEFRHQLEQITNVLQLRKIKANEQIAAQSETSQLFKKKLAELQDENVLLKNNLQLAHNSSEKLKQRIFNLESKVNDLELERGNYRFKIAEQSDTIKQLRCTITEKNMKINRNVLDREKTKLKLAVASERMTQELDAKLRRQREYLQATAKVKDYKLQKMRQLLDEEVDPIVSTVDERVDHPYSNDVAVGGDLKFGHGDSDEENFNPNTNLAQLATPLSPLTASKYGTPVDRSRPRTGTPYVKRRRSRSLTAEIWLEHNAVKPVPLGTLMQPSMKKRKSVTKLTKASDITHPKQSKYCLVSEEMATDNEMETKVYKGDILPTLCGGAQVVFNDVERLRQESPTKSSSNTNN